MLMTGHQNTRQNGMGRRTASRAVAAIGFAGDDCGSQHALGQIVGCLQVLDIQEAQKMRTVLTQAFGKASVLGIRETAGGCDQSIQASLQLAGLLGESTRREAGLLSLQAQRFLQESGCLASEVQGSARLGFVHVLEISEQMTDTFLLEPVLQSAVVIGQAAIRGQDALEVRAQDIEDHIAAAIISDGIDGDVAMGEDPQPGRERADPPTGLIRIDHAALPNSIQQFCVHWASRVSQLLIRLAPAAPADLQAKRIVEHFTHFAIRDAQTMLEVGGQRFGTGSDHDRGRTGRLRALFGMLRAYSFLTGPTVATVGHKARRLHFHHRNVRDELLMLVDLSQLAATRWTAAQFGFLCLADLQNLGQFSMSKFAFSRFASRLSRLLHPVPSRERRCLALSDPLQKLELFLKLSHRLLQAFDLLLLLLNDLQRLRQLLLQLCDLLIFWVGLRIPLPAFAHALQGTGFATSLTRVVSPVFSPTFDPCLSRAFAR
jgi:hypothetical protein